MTEVEQLRHFADNFEHYGPNLAYWWCGCADRQFVIEQLRKIADHLRDVSAERNYYKASLEKCRDPETGQVTGRD